jgi:hypothetical protein
MNKFNAFLFILVFSSLASAACSINVLKGSARDTTGKPIDQYSFDSNSTVLIGLQVSKDQANQTSNLDVGIFDSFQKRVSLTQLVLPSNVSYAEIQFNTSEQLLNGTYKIQANHSETACSASSQAEIFISTNRTAYNSSPLTIGIGLTTPLSAVDTCTNVTTQGIQYKVCVNGTVPQDWSFTVDKVITLNETDNATDFSALISVSTPYYSYDIVNALFQKYLSINNDFTQIAETNKQLAETNAAFANVTALQNEERFNNLLKQYADAQKDVSNQKNGAYWMGIFIGFLFLGIPAGIGIFMLYAWKKSKKTAVG